MSGGTKGSGKVASIAGPNEATEWYVSGEGMWINQYLRGRGGFGELSPQEKEFLKGLDNATSGKAPQQTLYRSVDASAVFGSMGDGAYENLVTYLNYGPNALGRGAYADGLRRDVEGMIARTEGKTITEKGFMSTTKSAEVAEEWGGFTGSSRPIVLRITPTTATRGVDLSSQDVEGAEQREVLLARGQSYKPTRVYSKNGYVYVDVSMRG